MTADVLAKALDAHLAGDMPQAERLYGEVLEADPAHVLALTNLATVQLQSGRLSQGVEALRRSLRLSPAQPIALNNLGNALRALDRPEEALDAYARAIACDPGYADALNSRAALLEVLGRLEEAAQAYGAAADAQPASAAPRHAEGLTLYRLGRMEPALAALRQAAALAPDSPDVHNDLGALLDENGLPEPAVEAFGRALALKPQFPEAMSNLGLALTHLGRSREALPLHDAALALNPDFTAAWFNRAEALCALGRFEPALAAFDRAIQLRPGHFHAMVRRADMLGYLRRIDEARAGYEQAQSIAVGDEPVGFRLAFPLLREGRYEEALPLYEQRWLGPLKDAQVQLPQPLWLGQTPAEGKTVLLHSEQGHGDTLMMLRYAPLLARRGAKVILSVQPPLERLAAAVEGVGAVIPQDQPLPPHDLHIPMMSLPLAFGARPDTVPGEPYLRAPEAERARWIERLGPARRPRVGLCWSGSAAQKDDRWRSIPLAQLRPLFDLDADLYALQTEIRDADLETLRASPIHDLSAALVSYADTAAVMEAMDLVITVCTSAANLACGLGRPALVMLGAMADWRWGLHPHASPWQPTARLFRQAAVGDWTAVIAAVTAEAEARLAASPT
jgi:tetratricopeptide (TPR) repeat protein